MLPTKPTLEICCYSLQSVISAAKAGAQRVELCADISAGGTTPSMGLIERALQVHGVSTYVIIRPRGGDFFYNEEEYDVMERDIAACEHRGVKGVVFGLLNTNGTVDVERTKRMTELAYPMDVTFHRAIDMSADIFEAMDAIHACGIRRILSSGGYNTAIEGLEIIKQMVEYGYNRIEVMVGSGVNATNIKPFYDAGVRAFHSSASSYIPSVMEYRNSNISMGNKTDVDEYVIQIADFAKIAEMKKVIDSLS